MTSLIHYFSEVNQENLPASKAHLYLFKVCSRKALYVHLHYLGTEEIPLP